ncbi:MAG TPA: acyltransferase [Steroidobacteraceae bacterium]
MGTRSSATEQRRNSAIDALRGLSILLVVVHHIGIRVPLSQTLLARVLPHWLLQGLNFNGAEAVIIFFVISGFLITRRSQERWGDLRDISVGGFYLLRMSRIVPLLLFVVAVLSLFHLLGVPRFVINKPGQSLGGAMASALGLYLNRYEGIHGYLPGGWDVIWSLSIEEVFYLAFPLSCLLLSRTRLLLPALGLLALSLPVTRATLTAGDNEIWLEKAYLPGMSAIAVGVLAALLVRRIPAVSHRLVVVMRLLGWAGVCTVLFADTWLWRLVHHGYGLFLAIAAACIVISAHWHETAKIGKAPIRGLHWLRSCGRLSYEIYLSHVFCVFGGLAIFNWSGPGGAWRFLWYPPILLACWLLGFVLSHGFTVPIERHLRRRFRSTPMAVPALICSPGPTVP